MVSQFEKINNLFDLYEKIDTSNELINQDINNKDKYSKLIFVYNTLEALQEKYDKIDKIICNQIQDYEKNRQGSVELINTENKRISNDIANFIKNNKNITKLFEDQKEYEQQIENSIKDLTQLIGMEINDINVKDLTELKKVIDNLKTKSDEKKQHLVEKGKKPTKEDKKLLKDINTQIKNINKQYQNISNNKHKQYQNISNNKQQLDNIYEQYKDKVIDLNENIQTQLQKLDTYNTENAKKILQKEIKDKIIRQYCEKEDITVKDLVKILDKYNQYFGANSDEQSKTQLIELQTEIGNKIIEQYFNRTKRKIDIKELEKVVNKYNEIFGFSNDKQVKEQFNNFKQNFRKELSVYNNYQFNIGCDDTKIKQLQKEKEICETGAYAFAFKKDDNSIDNELIKNTFQEILKNSNVIKHLINKYKTKIKISQTKQQIIEQAKAEFENLNKKFSELLDENEGVYTASLITSVLIDNLKDSNIHIGSITNKNTTVEEQIQEELNKIKDQENLSDEDFNKITGIINKSIKQLTTAIISKETHDINTSSKIQYLTLLNAAIDKYKKDLIIKMIEINKEKELQYQKQIEKQQKKAEKESDKRTNELKKISNITNQKPINQDEILNIDKEYEELKEELGISEEEQKGITDFMEHFNTVKISNIQNYNINNKEQYSYFNNMKDTELKIQKAEEQKKQQDKYAYESENPQYFDTENVEQEYNSSITKEENQEENQEEVQPVQQQKQKDLIQQNIFDNSNVESTEAWEENDLYNNIQTRDEEQKAIEKAKAINFKNDKIKKNIFDALQKKYKKDQQQEQNTQIKLEKIHNQSDETLNKQTLEINKKQEEMQKNLEKTNHQIIQPNQEMQLQEDNLSSIISDNIEEAQEKSNKQDEYDISLKEDEEIINELQDQEGEINFEDITSEELKKIENIVEQQEKKQDDNQNQQQKIVQQNNIVVNNSNNIKNRQNLKVQMQLQGNDNIQLNQQQNITQNQHNIVQNQQQNIVLARNNDQQNNIFNHSKNINNNIQELVSRVITTKDYNTATNIIGLLQTEKIDKIFNKNSILNIKKLLFKKLKLNKTQEPKQMVQNKQNNVLFNEIKAQLQTIANNTQRDHYLAQQQDAKVQMQLQNINNYDKKNMKKLDNKIQDQQQNIVKDQVQQQQSGIQNQQNNIVQNKKNQIEQQEQEYQKRNQQIKDLQQKIKKQIKSKNNINNIINNDNNEIQKTIEQLSSLYINIDQKDQNRTINRIKEFNKFIEQLQQSIKKANDDLNKDNSVINSKKIFKDKEKSLQQQIKNIEKEIREAKSLSETEKQVRLINCYNRLYNKNKELSDVYDKRLVSIKYQNDDLNDLLEKVNSIAEIKKSFNEEISKKQQELKGKGQKFEGKIIENIIESYRNKSFTKYNLSTDEFNQVITAVIQRAKIDYDLKEEQKQKEYEKYEADIKKENKQTQKRQKEIFENLNYDLMVEKDQQQNQQQNIVQDQIQQQEKLNNAFISDAELEEEQYQYAYESDNPEYFNNENIDQEYKNSTIEEKDQEEDHEQVQQGQQQKQKDSIQQNIIDNQKDITLTESWEENNLYDDIQTRDKEKKAIKEATKEVKVNKARDFINNFIEKATEEELKQILSSLKNREYYDISGIDGTERVFEEIKDIMVKDKNINVIDTINEIIKEQIENEDLLEKIQSKIQKQQQSNMQQQVEEQKIEIVDVKQGVENKQKQDVKQVKENDLQNKTSNNTQTETKDNTQTKTKDISQNKEIMPENQTPINSKNNFSKKSNFYISFHDKNGCNVVSANNDKIERTENIKNTSFVEYTQNYIGELANIYKNKTNINIFDNEKAIEFLEETKKEGIEYGTLIDISYNDKNNKNKANISVMDFGDEEKHKNDYIFIELSNGKFLRVFEEDEKYSIFECDQDGQKISEELDYENGLIPGSETQKLCDLFDLPTKVKVNENTKERFKNKKLPSISSLGEVSLNSQNIDPTKLEKKSIEGQNILQ